MTDLLDDHPSSATPPTLDDILRLQEAVFATRPALREIVAKRGTKTLYEYASEYPDVNLNPLILARQDQFIVSFRQVVARVLNTKIADEAAVQLKKYYFVSTADHHGPICHPFFLNSHLVSSITCAEVNQNDWKYNIALSCANVSFSNSSFPRGLLFHTEAEDKIKMHQLGFFPNTSEVRQARVFNYRPYGQEEIEKVKKRLAEIGRTENLAPSSTQVFTELLDEVYAAPEVLSAPGFSEQITKTNFALWRKMFSKLNGGGRDLLYIELEAVVAKLLLDFHLDADTTLHRLLFNPDYVASFIKYFDNIEAGFSTTAGWGTYLFWALPADAKYCKKMRYENGSLVADDNSYRVALNPEDLRAALLKKEIFPSSQFSLIVLSLYYGLKCLGGFCQVNYLTKMKDAYLALLQDHGETESYEAAERVQTKELGEDLSIAFVEGKRNNHDLATTLDIIAYAKSNAWENLVDEAKNLTLGEALLLMMPEFYHIMYPEIKRDPELARITAEDILKLTGVDRKIKTSATLAS